MGGNIRDSAPSQPVSEGTAGPGPPAVLDRRRYRKVRRFVIRAFCHAFLWDLLLARRPFAALRRPAVERWREIAARYRVLALEMGGVLIKLGQFLSARVDILPLEITRELAGLQDRVPPAPTAAVVAQIEADLGGPLAAFFPAFEPVAVGAASLAQVHRAALPSGQRVVVKALRPGIDVLVETDLAVLQLALRWLKAWKPIRRRVDLGRLAREFSSTTRRELDLAAEGRNAERFARLFAGEEEVGFPAVHWDYTRSRTLTMEDVGFLRVGDLAALRAAGVDPPEVARVIYGAYMRQILRHNFVHADPHPGNLFVLPLAPAGDGEPSPAGEDGSPSPVSRRAFRVYWVDFGMVAEIPERVRQGLRSHAIGLAQRDAARVVRSYVEAGVLLPGADMERLEQAQAGLLDRFWGLGMGRMREVAMTHAGEVLSEYRDLLLRLPFQFPVDLLFVFRAFGLLLGLVTRLDPEFDPWRETLPYARDLAAEEGRRHLLPELREALSRLLALPGRLDRVLAAAERSEMAPRVGAGPGSRSDLQTVAAGLRRLAWAVGGSALLLGGIGLYALRPEAGVGPWLAGAGAAAILWGLTR